MKISVTEIRSAMDKVLDHLEESGLAEIEIDEDFYWVIDDDQLYRVSQDPFGFTLGQLSSDCEAVRNVGSGRKEPIAYDLVWLAAVLQYIGARVVA